jgi:hypothetical protein
MSQNPTMFHRPVILNKSDGWEHWDDNIKHQTRTLGRLPTKHLSPVQNAALVSFSKAFLNGSAELMDGCEPPSALTWQLLTETVLRVQLDNDNHMKDIITTDHELWHAFGCLRLPPDILRAKLKHVLANALKVMWWWDSGESARWIDKIWYSKTTNYLRIRLSPDIERHVFHLKKNFCMLSVTALRNLTKQRRDEMPSRHTLWYMRFRQDTNLSWGTSKMMLDDFFKIGGVPSDHMHAKSWSLIHAKFIKPLQAALKTHTDITLDVVSQIRRGRQIIGFRYTVKFNKEMMNSWKRHDNPGIIKGTKGKENVVF